jgi:hypothetical protein
MWQPRPRRRTGLRGVQWNFDGFESLADALQAYDALTEAGIYAHVSRTETGPVIVVSKRDAAAASKILAKWGVL